MYKTDERTSFSRKIHERKYRAYVEVSKKFYTERKFATSNSDEISRRMENFSDAMTVIFSTYQSLDKVSAALIDFDLIICDEAHRTTGYGKDATAFTQVHDENFIRGKKRLYMTATPRLYTSEAKKKAADNDLILWSMDDAEIYGEEFFHISFGEAVEKKFALRLQSFDFNRQSAVRSRRQKNFYRRQGKSHRLYQRSAEKID